MLCKAGKVDPRAESSLAVAETMPGKICEPKQLAERYSDYISLRLDFVTQQKSNIGASFSQPLPLTLQTQSEGMNFALEAYLLREGQPYQYPHQPVGP